LGFDPGGAITRKLNSYSAEDESRMLYIDTFLGEQLADPKAKNQEYLQTRTLARLICGRSPHATGIFYPSVLTPIVQNLMVLPHAARNVLRNVTSMVVRVTKALRYGFYDFDILRIATDVDDNGRFVWREPNHPNEMFYYRLLSGEAAKIMAETEQYRRSTTKKSPAL
jgi:hypothetical protein